MHIVELDYEARQNGMEEANNTAAEEESNYSRIKARIANRSKDIDLLLRRGSTPCQVSEILGVHPDIVKAQVAKLEKDEEERREFLQMGIMSESLRTGGYVAIFR